MLGVACHRDCGEVHQSTSPELQRQFHAEVARFNAETGARQITVAEVNARLAAGEPVLFLDVREPDEQSVSTIAGARLTTPASASDLALPDNTGQLVVAYCTAGYRSGLAAIDLERRLGRPIYNLNGGIIEWFNNGGKVVDRNGTSIDRIHPYSEEWGKYVLSGRQTGNDD